MLEAGLSFKAERTRIRVSEAKSGNKVARRTLRLKNWTVRSNVMMATFAPSGSPVFSINPFSSGSVPSLGGNSKSLKCLHASPTSPHRTLVQLTSIAKT